jgi:hypothetical protein
MPHRDPKGRPEVTWGGITKDLRNITSKIEQETRNYASGFIPNFAKIDSIKKDAMEYGEKPSSSFIPNFAKIGSIKKDFVESNEKLSPSYISNLAKLETNLSGQPAILDYDKRIGMFMRNSSQPKNLDTLIAQDHPEGKDRAIKNSLKTQKSMGVMNKGFIPNFAVNDKSFVQMESILTINTTALTTLTNGIENLNTTLSNFETNLNNNTTQTNRVETAAPANITTTTNAPVNVVVNTEGDNNIAEAVGKAVQNAIPKIIDKVKLALGQKVPPSI